MPFYGGSAGAGIFQGQQNQATLEQTRAQTQHALQQMAIQAQNQQAEQQARQRALDVQRNQGAVFGAMYPQQPPGMPPPPAGTPAGGPMPPGPGVSSQPSAPPMQPPAGPPGAIPPAPMSGGAPMRGPAIPPPPAPYRPIPSAPPAMGAAGMEPPNAGEAEARANMVGPGGGLPPPPVAQAQTNTVTAGPQQGSVFMERFVQAMRKAGIPSEQWGAQLASLPPIVAQSIAEEIKARHDGQQALIKQAELILKTQELERKKEADTKKDERGNRALDVREDQGNRRLDIAEDANKIKRDNINRRIQASAGDPRKLLTDEDARFLAEQALAGDRTVMQNLGRGAQGAENVIKIRRFIRTLGQERGLTGADMAANTAEFEGLKAGERALGTRTANFGMAKSEAYEMADLVTQTSDAVSRTQFMPVNQALIAFEKNTGDVKVREFGAAINSFINAYARAISPTGTPTVSDKEHAREMLSPADSKEQVKGIIGQLKKEMEAAGRAPGTVKKELRAGGTAGGRQTAPKVALDYLKAHPETKAQFSAKYGYLPADAR